MAAPFRLVAGDSAPAQQSPTTCGSASLTVARMLVDPAFAAWITAGEGARAVGGRLPAPGTETTRFAAYEQVVAARTNGLVGPGGRLQLPWPRALGTPPWGARRELERGAAELGADYEVTWVRPRSTTGLQQAYAALRHRVRAGRPALLYVGNARLPRHVVLVLPATDGHGLDVYEPSAGQVVDLPEAAFVERRLAVAGWDVPWALVWSESKEQSAAR
jgi:hypothetical protein